MGIVQTLADKRISLDLRQAIAWAADTMPIPADESVQQGVLEFIAGRQRAMLLDAGYRYDLVDAVLAERGHNPLLAVEAVKTFDPWVEKPGWQSLLNAYGRTKRIVRTLPEVYAVRPELLPEPAASGLYEAYQSVRMRVGRDGSLDDLMSALAEIEPSINRFFDEILVMAEDPEVRRSRLGLCQAVSSLTDGIVDLSRVEGF
jgi:glycyl-tRNA synthetase